MNACPSLIERLRATLGLPDMSAAQLAAFRQSQVTFREPLVVPSVVMLAGRPAAGADPLPSSGSARS
jgi:hypothetical protein